MRQLQVYTYTIPALGSVQIPAPNDNFIVQASTGTVSVRGDTFGTLPNLVAGQGLKAVPFNRLELIDTSGAPNTVTILLTPAEFVNQVFSGSVVIVGALALDAATINALNRPELPTNYWNSVGATAANTAANIFTAAANVNGAIVLSLQSTNEAGSTGFIESFLLKATAPVNVVDGNVLALSHLRGMVAGFTSSGVDTHEAMRVPAGLGLWQISSVASTGGARAARYILL